MDNATGRSGTALRNARSADGGAAEAARGAAHARGRGGGPGLRRIARSINSAGMSRLDHLPLVFWVYTCPRIP